MVESGRFARQYVHTSGRTRAEGVDYALEALVSTTELGRRLIGIQQPMKRQILDLAATAISIAEIGAHLGVHVGLVRVLIGDMAAEKLIRVDAPASSGTDGPDIGTLQILLRELEALDK